MTNIHYCRSPYRVFGKSADSSDRDGTETQSLVVQAETAASLNVHKFFSSQRVVNKWNLTPQKVMDETVQEPFGQVLANIWTLRAWLNPLKPNFSNCYTLP